MQSKYCSCTVSIVHNISTVQCKMEKNPISKSQAKSVLFTPVSTILTSQGAGQTLPVNSGKLLVSKSRSKASFHLS